MKAGVNYRPDTFKEFIGQKKLVESLRIMINSAKERSTILDSILFFGPPGLGKTTLANIIAGEMNAKLHYAQGALIQKQADILSLFATIKEGDLIFIDEIHSINKVVEEMIYSAIEDFVIDLPIGVDGERRIMRMKLPKFTLIGATTKFNHISAPMRDRFGLLAKLSFYNLKEIKDILRRNSANLGMVVEEDALELLALSSKFTPRLCINLLKRSNDFALYDSKTSIDVVTVRKTLNLLGINHLGLNTLQIDYLKCLHDVFEKK